MAALKWSESSDNEGQSVHTSEKCKMICRDSATGDDDAVEAFSSEAWAVICDDDFSTEVPPQQG